MSKTSKITIEVSEDQLRAYNEFSADKGKSLDKKFSETFRSLYEESVPQDVRRFISLTEQPEKGQSMKPKRGPKQSLQGPTM